MKAQNGQEPAQEEHMKWLARLFKKRRTQIYAADKKAARIFKSAFETAIFNKV